MLTKDLGGKFKVLMRHFSFQTSLLLKMVLVKYIVYFFILYLATCIIVCYT